MNAGSRGRPKWTADMLSGIRPMWPGTGARAALARALGMAALWVSVVGAQPVTSTAPDTLGGSAPVPVAPAIAPTDTPDLLDTPATDSVGVVIHAAATPRSFLWRSAVLPGWGQWRGGHPIKTILFGGAAIGWATAIAVEHDRIAQATPLEKQERVGRRNTRVLWYVITATAAALDAYVDAHLDDFNVEEGFVWSVSPTPDQTMVVARWPLDM